MIELKTARYKGVEFLFEDAPTTGGNRLIKFNYPGSDKQSIERQGRAPRSFTLTAVIPHDDYYAERDNLLRVLEDGTAGTLTHPTFGDISNVINGVYTLTENITELGRAKVSIPFEVDDFAGIPVESSSVAPQVVQQSLAAIEQLATDFADTYDVGLNFPANYGDADDNVAALVAALRTASTVTKPIADKAAEFTKQINAFEVNTGRLIQAPPELAEAIAELYATLNTVFEAPEELLAEFSTLFSFGDDDPDVPRTTAGRIQRDDNRAAMRTITRGVALAYAYSSAVQVEYQTTDDLEAVQNSLEAAYVDLRTNQAISNESLEQMDRLRVNAQAAFDVALVSTKSVITVYTPRRPLSVLVYEYYGSTELVDTIADLNGILQNAFVEGDVRILAL